MTEQSAYREQALVAARAIDEKKGSDIVIQDVSDLLNVTDYFVICTAANNRRVDAIAEEVEDRLEQLWDAAPTVDVAIAGIEDPVYTDRIARLLERAEDAD